jgi:hypothetical protein
MLNKIEVIIDWIIYVLIMWLHNLLNIINKYYFLKIGIKILFTISLLWILFADFKLSFCIWCSSKSIIMHYILTLIYIIFIDLYTLLFLFNSKCGNEYSKWIRWIWWFLTFFIFIDFTFNLSFWINPIYISIWLFIILLFSVKVFKRLRKYFHKFVK